MRLWSSFLFFFPPKHVVEVFQYQDKREEEKKPLSLISKLIHHSVFNFWSFKRLIFTWTFFWTYGNDLGVLLNSLKRGREPEHGLIFETIFTVAFSLKLKDSPFFSLFILGHLLVIGYRSQYYLEVSLWTVHTHTHWHSHIPPFFMVWAEQQKHACLIPKGLHLQK